MPQHAKKTFLLNFSLLCAGMMLFGLAIITAPVLAAPPAQSPEQQPDLLNGEAIWLENCAPCHGSVGQGDGPVAASGPAMNLPDFTDSQAARDRSLAEIFDVTKNGRMENLMPPWLNQLTDAQIWDVSAYAWSLANPAPWLALGETAYLESCAECHASDGQADEIDLSQADTLANLSDQAIFVSLQSDDNSDIHAVAQTMDEDTLWQTIAYARSLSFNVPAADGVLEGQVINLTTSAPQAEVELILFALNAESTPVQTYTAFSDAEGRFSFTDLPRRSNLSYVVEGIYRNIPYFTQTPVNFADGEAVLNVELPVYELTASGDDVYQSRLHRIISFSTNEVNVADVIVFGNQGNETYIGESMDDGSPGTVKIGLPDNATDVAFRSNSVRPVSDYYADGRAIPPGVDTYSLFVTYNIPIQGDSMTIETPVYYDVAEVNIIAVDLGQEMQSDQLEPMGTEVFQGEQFQVFGQQNLSANENLVLNVSGLSDIEFETPAGGAVVGSAPAQSREIDSQLVVMWVLIGAGVVMIIFGLFYTGTGLSFLNRNREPATIPAATPISAPSNLAPASAPSLEQQRDKLLALLAELDSMYADGDLDEATYHQARRKHRAELKEILLQQHEQDS
jgi:mono/diheme cytochrome c family protein